MNDQDLASIERLESQSSEPSINDIPHNQISSLHPLGQIQTHRYCYRHIPSNPSLLQDQKTEILKRLDRVSIDQRDRILSVWSLFESSSACVRNCILDGILYHACLPQLSYLSNYLGSLTRVDFLSHLPSEISLKILYYLDARSLCQATQISRAWNQLADDDRLWQRMCSQHIDKKCTKCGWGLPLMKPNTLHTSSQPFSSDPSGSHNTITGTGLKRKEIEASSSISSSQSSPRLQTHREDEENIHVLSKRIKTTSPSAVSGSRNSNISSSGEVSTDSNQEFERQSNLPTKPQRRFKRPWKEIYAERQIVERNWRKSQYSVSNLIGHTGVICTIYFDTSRSLLVSGSGDGDLRAWNTDTGECIGIMKGHTDNVKGVQFDESKIISCSMDKTIRIWCAKSFRCCRVVQGHTAGVLCLHFQERMLASGSIDGSIRVWNLGAGESFTLNGHTDWVNKVQILSNGEQLLSCSDDSRIHLWNLETKSIIRTFAVPHDTGFLCMKLLVPVSRRCQPVIRRLVTGSLDNTIRIWNFDTGEQIATFFGHLDAVTCLDVDTLRIVSTSQDETVKVWDLDTGKCVSTFTGYQGPVNCCWLSDTKLITGDMAGVIKIYDFLKVSIH